MTILTKEVEVGDIISSKTAKEEMNGVMDGIVLAMEVVGNTIEDVSLVQDLGDACPYQW